MNSHENYHVLCGLRDPLQAVAVTAFPPFADAVIAFLSDVSALLLQNSQARKYPEISAFAFFCRKANLRLLQQPYDDLESRLGRGLVFHIAPGNVPMNFAYSLAASLLAGNASIVKAPSKAFAQVDITCSVMQTLLETKHQSLLPYVTVVTYAREQQEITETFSAICDARIIWGGDETIRRVRLASLPPRAYDITFADRWSLALLDANKLLALSQQEVMQLAKGFYNDTYLYDQNACTSPRLVVWMGGSDAVASAKVKFWEAVHALAADQYSMDTVIAVDKLTALYRAAMQLEGIRQEKTKDNLLFRIHLASLTQSVLDLQIAGGCFLEYDAQKLAELIPVLTNKTQTLACFGVPADDVRAWIHSSGVRGVDRIVKIGHTMDFSLIWDGYDLIRSLSRSVL